MSAASGEDAMGRSILFAMLAWSVVAGFAVAQEREWSLGASGEDVFLAFGVPETADIGVSFWCKIGGQDLSLFAPLTGPLKDNLKVSLAVGGRDFALDAKFSDGSIEAALKPQGDVLAALKTADRFGLAIGKHKTIFPLNGADFDGLLTMCADKGNGVE
jgi:hypothetical protein